MVWEFSHKEYPAWFQMRGKKNLYAGHNAIMPTVLVYLQTLHKPASENKMEQDLDIFRAAFLAKP